MGSAGQVVASASSSRSESLDEFTNMAAAAVSSGSNGSNTNASSAIMAGIGLQRSYSLSQQPTFASTVKQQPQHHQAVFHGHPPHVQQFNNQHQQQVYAQNGPASAPIINSATSPTSTGASSANASTPAPAPGSSSIPQSSSFPMSATSHRVAGSTYPSGDAGLHTNGPYSSNEHFVMMHNGGDSTTSGSLAQSPSSATATFPPRQSNLHPGQQMTTSNTANTSNHQTQPAYINRTSSPLSYALQSFPSTSSAQPLASTSAAIPATANAGVRIPTMQQQLPSEQTFAEKVELFSSVSVSDHRHLFHAYIYDYLYRQGYERTARAFLQDAPNVPTKQKKDRKSKQKAATATASSSSSLQAGNSRNKRKRSESEDNDLIISEKEEIVENDHMENVGRPPKKRPTSQTSLSNMPESILEEENDNDEELEISIRSRNASNQDGKPSTSSSEDSNSTASSSLFFGSSTKDSSSNASLSTHATTVTTTSIQTGMESHTATKGSDAGTATSAGDDNDTTINSTNSPLGSRDNLFSPALFSPNQSPDKSNMINKDNIEIEEDDQAEELPLPDIQIDSNWGFLYEWWEVFWDVWRAKGAKGAGSLAAKAYEKTLHEFPQPTLNGVPIATIQPGIGGLPIYTGQQDHLLPQQQVQPMTQAPPPQQQHQPPQQQQAPQMSHGPSQTQYGPGVAAPKLTPAVPPSRQHSIALTSSVASNTSQLSEEKMTAQPPQNSNTRVVQPRSLRRMESDSVVQLQRTDAAATAEESRHQQERHSEPAAFVSPPARAVLQNQPSLRTAPAQLQGQPQQQQQQQLQQQQRNAGPPQGQTQNRPSSPLAQNPATQTAAPHSSNETAQQLKPTEQQQGLAPQTRPPSVSYQQQQFPLHMQQAQQGQPLHLQAQMQQQQGVPHVQNQPMQPQPQHSQHEPHPEQMPMQHQQQLTQPAGPALQGIPEQVAIAVASAPGRPPVSGPVAGRRLAVSGPPAGYTGASGQPVQPQVSQMQLRPMLSQVPMAGQVQIPIQPGQPVRMIPGPGMPGQPLPGPQHVAVQPSHQGGMGPQPVHMHPHLQHQHVQGQLNPMYVQGAPPAQMVYQGHPGQAQGPQRILSHPQMQPQMVQQHQIMPVYAQQPGRPTLVQAGPGQPLQQMQHQGQPVGNPQQGPSPESIQQRTRPSSVAGHQMQGQDVDMSSPIPGSMRAPSRSSGSPFVQYANPPGNGAGPQYSGKPQPIDLQAHDNHFAHPGQQPQGMPHQGLQVDQEAFRRQGMLSPIPGRDSGPMHFQQQQHQQQQQQARMQEMQRQANGQLPPGQQPGMTQHHQQQPVMQQQGQPMSKQQLQHQYQASMRNNQRQMSQVNGQSPSEMSYSPQTAPAPSNLSHQQNMPQQPVSPFPLQQQNPQQQAQQHMHHQQQQQQQAMQQHHHQQQLQQHQHQQQLQERQHQQQQLHMQQQQQMHQQQQLQPNGQPQQAQQAQSGQPVFKSPLPNNVQQQQGATNSPQPHDFAYSGNMQPGQQHQQNLPEEYRDSPRMTQQQMHLQQQMHEQNGHQQPQQGHDQHGRQIPNRQFSQQQVETGPMPPPPVPSGRRGAMAPAPNGQHMPRAPTPASTAATPTTNGVQQGSPDPQHQPLTPHTPRTPNAQAISSGASAPGSGNSSKAAPPVAAKSRKRTNTDTGVKEKKPRVSKAKEKVDAKAKEAQAATQSTPQSQATPLPAVDDGALYKAPMQQQHAQQNGMHQQVPTPQQQAPTPQQQQQMQLQAQQQATQYAAQQAGNIDVPQFSPNLDFSFGDLGDFTQFGIENMSTGLTSNPLLGDDGAINFDDFLVSGWQSTS